jgi:hypothetical protein
VSVEIAGSSVDEGSEPPVGETVTTSTAGGPGSPGRGPRRRGRSTPFNVAIVAIVGLLITAALSLGAFAIHNSNEDRLLKQRVREVGLVVTAAVPSTQTPLASAAVLAESTNGDREAFRR